MKRKTNKNYKFGNALKEASPIFHAKYGKKGKYEKKGGDPKIGGGDEVITDKQKAIDDINKCTSRKDLDALALRIVDLLDSEPDVRDLLENKKKGFAAAVAEVVDAPVGSAADDDAEVVDAPEVVTTTKGETGVVDAEVVDAPEVVTTTVGETGVGGKKAKKSAKKGKKSAKKGGKKARKSAKKGKR
jgi:hypothetical protein